MYKIILNLYFERYSLNVEVKMYLFLTLDTNKTIGALRFYMYLRNLRTVKFFMFPSVNKTYTYILDKVRIHELVGALRKTTSHGALKKQLNRVQKKETLNVPLSKPEKERV